MAYLRYKLLTDNPMLVNIPTAQAVLEGNLEIPQGSCAIVVFAHGSGSSRLSPRNTFVAQVLQKAGLATLLFDLLTNKEDEIYENRFNISLLTPRLKAATAWVQKQLQLRKFSIGYFGASTGAAAALDAAADLGGIIKAVVSRGGRPDMAAHLEKVKSPTLLIVGGNDEVVIELNKKALAKLSSEKELKIIPSAGHLFEEPGALEEVARLAVVWFSQYLHD